jgi:type IV pilus assembly protein PilA
MGFTLIEIMVVTMIITTLLAIAVPNFLRSRETTRSRGCVKNLRTISMAKEQYAMDNHLDPTSPMPTLAELSGNGGSAYIKGTEPLCPSDGDYSVNALNTEPTCSYVSPGIPHVLP